MGIFDVFKTNKKTFGTLHCLDTREWNDGSKFDKKVFDKYLKKELKNKSEKEFIEFLKNRNGYRKFIDRNISKKVNQITCKKYLDKNSFKGTVTSNIDFFLHITEFVDSKDDLYFKGNKYVHSFRFFDNNFKYDADGNVKMSKSKVLSIIHISNDTNYWANKNFNYSKKMRTLYFQYMILDNLEYNFLKKYEKMFKDIKNDTFAKTWFNTKVVNSILGYPGFFDTNKRKKRPVDMFQNYLAFEE